MGLCREFDIVRRVEDIAAVAVSTWTVLVIKMRNVRGYFVADTFMLSRASGFVTLSSLGPGACRRKLGQQSHD